MGQLAEKFKSYRLPQKFMEAGVYPYFREITGKQGTEKTHEVVKGLYRAYLHEAT